MNRTSVGGALIAVGAVAVMAGVLMYVLPGPGLPVLVVGTVLTAAGAAVRLLGSGRNERSRSAGP
ncbi:hypothetical protein [Streptomyces sp. enrichment culture]|uniref:hypothetical protein n=1 Tax=Streptomyces sp. enrichment culture TaxID=1795815 RepID=UPI003F580104